MYKWVLTHDVLPGKLHEMREWFIQQDAERKATLPDYPRVKRYTTVFGRVHQVICEVEQEQFPEEQWHKGWTSGYATIRPEGPQASFLQLIVPGNSALSLLKELDLGARSTAHAESQATRYKVLLSHDVLPGKLPKLNAWFLKQDEERKQRDPSYIAPRQFTTVFGHVHQVVIEVESAEPPHSFAARGYAEYPADGAQEAFLQMIVPGHSTMLVWKTLL